MSDLKERLRARKSFLDAYGNVGCTLVNRDGERAAARIEELEAKLATATEALKRIAYHVPSFDYAGRDEYGHIRTDFPGSPYDRGKADACKRLSGIAETAIRALKSTTQP